MAYVVSPRLRDALDAGQPMVALESTVIAHGLPYPQNLEVAQALEDVVRAAGAIPATIGVVAGSPTIGMDAHALERFARGSQVLKLSRREIAYAVAHGRDGATPSPPRWRWRRAPGLWCLRPAGLVAC